MGLAGALRPSSSHQRVKLPPFAPVRETRARTDRTFSHRRSIATFHRDAPARCGALADERRVVAGETKNRWRKGSSSVPAVLWLTASVGRAAWTGVPTT
jgi:hypothetical protein